MSGTLPWYVARASGLVAWALLAASVIWGLLMTSKIVRRFARNSWLLDLHRWLGGLALAFTGVHVVAIMLDTYVHFGLASVLVPLAATWHPVMVAFGIVSLYLLAAVELTSLMRRRLSRTLWKRVHFLSFPLFVLSTIHGVTAGTDSRTPMAVITAALTLAAVAGLATIRFTDARRHATRAPRPDGALGRVPTPRASESPTPPHAAMPAPAPATRPSPAPATRPSPAPATRQSPSRADRIPAAARLIANRQQALPSPMPTGGSAGPMLPTSFPRPPASAGPQAYLGPQASPRPQASPQPQASPGPHAYPRPHASSGPPAYPNPHGVPQGVYDWQAPSTWTPDQGEPALGGALDDRAAAR